MVWVMQLEMVGFILYLVVLWDYQRTWQENDYVAWLKQKHYGRYDRPPTCLVSDKLDWWGNDWWRFHLQLLGPPDSSEFLEIYFSLKPFTNVEWQIDAWEKDSQSKQKPRKQLGTSMNPSGNTPIRPSTRRHGCVVGLLGWDNGQDPWDLGFGFPWCNPFNALYTVMHLWN